MYVCEVLVPSAHFLLPFEACVLVAHSYDGWELIIEELLDDLPSQLTFGRGPPRLSSSSVMLLWLSLLS